jgi:hypothetical protein
MICHKLYQLERITWWCLFAFKYVMESNGEGRDKENEKLRSSAQCG